MPRTNYAKMWELMGLRVALEDADGETVRGTLGDGDDGRVKADYRVDFVLFDIDEVAKIDGRRIYLNHPIADEEAN